MDEIIDVNAVDGEGLIDPQLALSDPPSKPEDKDTPEVTSEPEAKEGDVTQKPDPESMPWWKNTEYMSQGITSEEQALKTIKEQRQWTTQTTQENAKLKRRDDAYRKYFAGELENENVETYIAEQEHEFETNVKVQNEQQRLINERINAAIEVGKIKYPGIVTDENLPDIVALAGPSPSESPLERLEYGVNQFKKLTGVANEKAAKVASTKAEMKKTADMEGSGKSAPEQPKGAWDMTSDEWNQSVQSARFA